MEPDLVDRIPPVIWNPKTGLSLGVPEDASHVDLNRFGWSCAVQPEDMIFPAEGEPVRVSNSGGGFARSSGKEIVSRKSTYGIVRRHVGVAFVLGWLVVSWTDFRGKSGTNLMAKGLTGPAAAQNLSIMDGSIPSRKIKATTVFHLGPGELDVTDSGDASWYDWDGRETASGEIFDSEEPTCAHKTLPLGSVVDVVNLENGKTERLTVNDRGPYIDGRVVDVSRSAAEKLGFLERGVVKAKVVLVSVPTNKKFDFLRRLVAGKPKSDKNELGTKGG
jgi:hypothetical protein